MLVCCNREMKVEKNGVGVETLGGVIFPGDRYVCMACGRTVIIADKQVTITTYTDPDHEMFSEYIVLKQ